MIEFREPTAACRGVSLTEPWGWGWGYGRGMFTVIEAARQIRAGEVGARELLRECLARIDRTNPALNAWAHLDPESAATAAAEVDEAVAGGRADELGPLAGVPFGVKDLEDCAGMPTTRGSRWYQGRPPVTTDDLHVARLRAAGAIPIGKTTAPEFGAWAYTASPALGVTRNPWNTERTPGGSSGGSSASVSAGLVPFCTASDGGGSIRTPAAFTGLPGLKPTYGRVPTYGVTHQAQNAVNFALATTVADTALLLDLTAGHHPLDRTSLPSPGISYLDSLDAIDTSTLRIGWSLDLGFAIVDPEVRAICEQAAQRFGAAAGSAVFDAEVHLRDYIGTYVRFEVVDMFVGVDPDLWQHHLDQLDPLVAPGWRSAPSVTAPDIGRTEARRRALVHQMAEVFDRVDLLLTPMTCLPAFAAEGPMPTTVAGQSVHGGMAVIHGMLANLVNLPAMSVPAGVTTSGLPIGLQVIGPRHREDLVLAAAARYEAASPWPRHAPATSPAAPPEAQPGEHRGRPGNSTFGA
jgi:aspartyl-tRNA(Asn)/glutamyl-tRNA(Gln) amidotransferase subunit A